MSMRMGLMSAVVVVSMVGCGVEQEEDGLTAVAKKQEPITFNGTTGGNTVDGIASSQFWTGSWVYGRSTSTNRLVVKQKQDPSANGWNEEGFLTESFAGSPGATPINGPAGWHGACDMIVARRATGVVGYAPQIWMSNDFWCRSNATTLTTIPNSPGVSGSPRASSWYSGGQQRVDVFVRNTVGNIASVTGTGSSALNLTWSSWSIDTGIVLLNGTDPAAVSFMPGRIDLFACDTTNTLRHRVFSGGAWGAWGSVAAGCYSSPSATGRTVVMLNKTYVELDVVVRGLSPTQWRAAYYYSGPFGGWSYWNDLGGSFSGAPAIHYNTGYYYRRVWGYHTGLGGIAWGDY